MPTDPTHNPFIEAGPAVRSLNRARLMALPGIELGPASRGQSGWELLGAERLRREAARALGLERDDPGAIRHLDAALADPQREPRAARVARDYGERLAHWLLGLKRGGAENRAARPEWTDAHWQFWARVRRVALGGELLAGEHLGPAIVGAAQARLAELGGTDLALERARWPAQLALLGLARLAAPTARRLLVLDFGQTAVKRGLARLEAGVVTVVEIRSSRPSACGDPREAPVRAAVEARWDKMVEIVAEAWEAVPAAQRTDSGVALCLACYLRAGQPAPEELGCYGSLQLLTPHLADFIATGIGERLGRALPVAVVHDGNAAALAYTGARPRPEVVLTLGTAIGNGFPPDGEDLRPLSDRLVLVGADGG